MTDRPHDHQAPDLTPEDLTPQEMGVSAWFDTLERRDAPAALRARVLDGPKPQGKLLRMFPMGAWGVATAALVLVALGAAVSVELLDPVEPTQAPTAQRPAQPARSMTLVEDPTMALFHDLATFEDVGKKPDSIIADWQR